MRSRRSSSWSSWLQKISTLGRVAQVQAVDAEATAPVGEVRLGGVAPRGVVGKAGGGDDGGPGPQELERGLVADLDPGPGDEGHAALEVGGLEALLVVEGGALGAQGVVEGVHPPVLGLADVAGPGLLDLAVGPGLGRLPDARRGGGTKTSASRAARMPVRARTSRSRFSTWRRRRARRAFTRRRFCSVSGWTVRPAAVRRRVRSSMGSSARSERSATTASSTSRARRRSSGPRMRGGRVEAGDPSSLAIPTV